MLSEVNLKRLEHTTARIINQLRKSNYWDDHFRTLDTIVQVPSDRTATIDQQTISLTSDPTLKTEISTFIKKIVPWRMGPFKINDDFIDGEWRSDIQWQLLASATEEIKGEKIIDIGCSSGYLSLRLALADKDNVVVGIDPVERCFLQSQLVGHLSSHQNISFLPYALADCLPFEGYFNRVFCLGVFYHQRDPHLALKQLFDLLQPNGTLILESITAPSYNGLDAIVPKDRYAMMRNCWYIPTSDHLHKWIAVAGFKDIEQIYSYQITPDHQRATSHSPYQSIKDFLDPNNPNLTIEGYPAPWKTAYRAKKFE